MTTFTILNPSENEQLEISGYRPALVKGEKLSVNVLWRKGVNTVMAETSYQMTIVKEEGPKVWLGDGTGNGFIIKK